MRLQEKKARLGPFFFESGNMVYPSRAEFERLSRENNLIPLYSEILADLDTPVSAFLKLDDGNYSYLLESVERGEKLGRYSFIGIDPFLVFQSMSRKASVFYPTGKSEEYEIDKDPLDFLKQIMRRFRVVSLPQLPIFFGGAVGYVGYDVIRFWEKIPHVGKEDLNLPECFFILTKNVIIFDHLDHKIKLVGYAFLNGESPAKIYQQTAERIEKIIYKLSRRLPQISQTRVCPQNKSQKEKVLSNFTPQEFEGCVREAKEFIKAGDIFQVVLSQRFSRKIDVSPFEIYRVLRSLNPSPYMYYLKCGDFSLVGSSPEILVRKEGKRVVLRPIAGTRPRGKSDQEDTKLASSLLNDKKEKAEHIMLVDLGRNDLGRVCQYGTVKVKELFSLERYSHVIHLVSEVEGMLRKEVDQFDLLRACFPAGTVSGAPKVRAMQIIEELEPSKRGPYAGALGYFSFSGNMDTCIIIRTVIVSGDTAYIQAGAGIVADSIPEREFEETQNKAKALIRAIEIAEEKKEWFW